MGYLQELAAKESRRRVFGHASVRQPAVLRVAVRNQSSLRVGVHGAVRLGELPAHLTAGIVLSHLILH